MGWGRSLSVKVALLCLAPLMAGCLMPASGPYDPAIRTGIVTNIPYALIPLKPDTVRVLAEYEPAGLAGVFTDRRAPTAIVFGVGDVVSVTIFEAAAGGLFIPIEAGVRPGNFVTIPDQTVDNEGNVTVPYAGTVKAAGRTNVEVQNDIVQRIRNRAIEPQVVVSQTKQQTSLVSVLGEVNAPIRYPAAALGAGDRITDAITRAGGIKGQGFESWVMLERKGKRATVPFANLVYEPNNNIYVQPNDRIYVYREQQKFMAFGAQGQQGEFPFDAWRINLATAVAKAGGLNDGQAEPASVFLYRLEPREVAKRLTPNLPDIKGDLIPCIFNVNLRDPGGYFLATNFQMRNQDIIYVANAASVEITKFLQFLNVIMGSTNNGIVTYQNFKNLKNAGGAQITNF